MSFWRNDEDPPVKQTQVAISSTNGLSYTGGQRIDFQIPNNIELFDGRNCYLNFDVKLNFPAGAVPTRLQLDSTLGGQSLIKNIRIFENGGSGKLLEEISDYNTKVSVQYSYNTDESLRNIRALQEGCLTHTPDNRGTLGTSRSNLINTKYNPYYKSKTLATEDTVFDDTDLLTTKVCLPIHSGIFADSIQAFPNFLFRNGLRVELDLESPERVIKQLDSVNRFRRVAQNPVFYGTDTAGADWVNNGQQTQELLFNNENNMSEVGNCPFVVGEHLNFCQIDDENVISNIQDNAGPNPFEHPVIASIDTVASAAPFAGLILLRLTLDKPYRNPVGGGVSVSITGAGAGPAIANNFVAYSTAIDNGTANIAQITSYNATFTVSNCELVVQSLQLDGAEKNKMLSNMREGGAMELDLLSCSNYKHSLASTNRQATINLPLSNTRAKSILVVPTDSGTYNSAQLIGGLTTYIEEQAVVGAGNLLGDQILQSNRTGYTGIIDYLTSYQWNISDTLTPSRPVNVSKINQGRSISAQQITELDKALNQSRIVPRSFHHFNRNFVIGRAYALSDGVADLRNRTNQLQLSYNETTAPTKEKLLNCFVFHIRRVVVRGDNVFVLL